MNMNCHSQPARRRLGPLLTGALLFSAATAAHLSAQTAPAASAAADPTTQPPKDETVVLSPFTVSTDKDQGYKATNATSGTRLNAAIKDLPMPMEVITDQFIKDTGALTLRDALRYSAGIQLQSQNDYAGNGLAQYQNPGGVNNPEMQTANKTDTSIVIRGFTTDNALRDGFRRKVTTDAVNISRIEVVRGPAALLYGIGNFGGVVNYLVKTPSYTTDSTNLDFELGTYGLRRGTVDASHVLVRDKLATRFTAAVQDNGDYTDYYHVRKFSLSDVTTYHPWEHTEFTVDLEYGHSHNQGTGFQSIRARADAVNNSGREEHAGFIAFPGMSLRTQRWSGPETFVNTYQGNLELKLTQQIFEGLNLLIGYNHSSVTFATRDVDAAARQDIGPSSLWSTLTPVPLDPYRGDTDANWAASPFPRSIIAYSWVDGNEGTRSDQERVELTYHKALFTNRRWLGWDNTFLVGLGNERDKGAKSTKTLDASNNVFDWKSAADPTPFRYAVQGDGTPSLPLRLRTTTHNTSRELGKYAIYQGKFLDDHITLLGGVRWDRNGVSLDQTGYLYANGAVDPGATYASNAADKTYRTDQIGVSISPIRPISFYYMRSQGINPNFSGAVDLTGRPMDAVVATDKEYGVKFDLWHGRISGTISHYQITRSGQPNGQFWWGPQTAIHKFDPSKDTVYNVTDLNPDAASKYMINGSPLIQWNNNYAWYGPLAGLNAVPAGAQGATANAAGLQSYQKDNLDSARAAIVSSWNAAKSAGAVKYFDANGASISEAAFSNLNLATSRGFITVDASTPQGAAYMDAVYGYTRQAGIAHPGSDNWPGWFFNSAPASTGYNSAAQDTNAFAGLNGSAPESDRNEGWDGQLILTPNDDWQVVFSFSKNNHTIRSLGQFPTYPNQGKDRWAPWMFPNGQWGLSGYYAPNQQYTNEADTSTFSFKGMIYPGAQGMDYPKWSWSLFTDYRLTPLGLKNLRLGAGAIRTGPQEYESGYTHGGDALKDGSGIPLILTTPLRWTFNFFARYDFKLQQRDAYVQVNIDNVLDDQHHYGLLWAPGRSIKVGFGTAF